LDDVLHGWNVVLFVTGTFRQIPLRYLTGLRKLDPRSIFVEEQLIFLALIGSQVKIPVNLPLSVAKNLREMNIILNGDKSDIIRQIAPTWTSKTSKTFENSWIEFINSFNDVIKSHCN
jgi:hypothetical protein